MVKIIILREQSERQEWDLNPLNYSVFLGVMST